MTGPAVEFWAIGRKERKGGEGRTKAWLPVCLKDGRSTPSDTVGADPIRAEALDWKTTF